VPIPKRLAHLPVDAKWGLPVPYFVEWLDGKPEFRIADGDAWLNCVQSEVCWICGQKLGNYRAFVIGPMCSINRVSADPPGHRECMEYATQVCPFMLNPKFERREANRPAEYDKTSMAGFPIERNPGVMLLWVTRRGDYQLISDGGHGYLFSLKAEPVHTAWYCEGRMATRAEIDQSIKGGFPILFEQAQAEGDLAIAQLLKQRMIAEKYLPAEVPVMKRRAFFQMLVALSGLPFLSKIAGKAPNLEFTVQGLSEGVVPQCAGTVGATNQLPWPQYEQPVGTLCAFYGENFPSNWRMCDGTVIDQSEFPQLAELLPTHKLPDLNGFIIKADLSS
jgi:Phage Tail Collar Domain